MEKFFADSKTFWGILIMAAPQLRPLAEVLGLGGVFDAIISADPAVEQTYMAFGAWLAWYGRQKAEGRLTVNPMEWSVVKNRKKAA